MTSFDRLELAKGFGGRKTAIADTAHTRNYAGNLAREFASTFQAMRYKNVKDADAIKSHIARRISRRETQRALYAKAVKHKTLLKKLKHVKPLAIAAAGGIAVKHLVDKRMTLSLSATGLIKHASHGLKNRTVRDYLKMRFAKAAPAAGRVASRVAHSAGPAATGAAALGATGAVAHKLYKSSLREGDTTHQKVVRAHHAGYGATLGSVAVGAAGLLAAKSTKSGFKAAARAHREKEKIKAADKIIQSGIKTKDFGSAVYKAVRGSAKVGVANHQKFLRSGAKGVAAVGLLGAATAAQGFEKHKNNKSFVKASFDASMVLSHDAEFRLDLAFANRQSSILGNRVANRQSSILGNRVASAHTTVSQHGNQIANAIGGGAALAAGSKLMHKAAITSAVRATLKGGGIKSAAMKFGMRSRRVAGVAAVGAGLHMLNKARKPIAASNDDYDIDEEFPLELSMGNSMMGRPGGI